MSAANGDTRQRLVRPSRRAELAREFFELNHDMTWYEAVDEAGMAFQHSPRFYWGFEQQ